MRSKNNDLRDAYASLKRKLETDAAAGYSALEEWDTSIAHLRSLLDRRKKEWDNLEQSATVTQEERTRLQLHSSAVTVEIVSLRQEIEDSRAATASARVSEEAGWLQLARMMDDQLAQNQMQRLFRQPS